MAGEAARRERKRYWEALLPVGFILLATAIGYLFMLAGFPETNIVLVYLAAVLMTARYTGGYVYGLVASVAATFAFNYFFTEPRFTFAVNDTDYLITFAIMTFTSLATSALTSRVKHSAWEATERERETRALYHLTNQLSDAQSIERIGQIAIESISRMLSCNAAFWCFDDSGLPERTFQQYTCDGVVRRDVDPQEDILHLIQYEKGEPLETREFSEWSVYGQEKVLGIVRLPISAGRNMSDAQKRLLMAMIKCVAMAIDRFKSTQAQQRYREETQQERYRSNLLQAISHDLRTPLSGIMGASEMIRDLSDENDPRRRLAEEIWSDTDWLHGLVENILSLTRLEEGRLSIRKQPEAVEEVVGSAVCHMEKRAPEHTFGVDIPSELLMVPMDARLIVQVLVNLMDNAVKHTPGDEEISVKVQVQGEYAAFTVLDHGQGIAPDDLPHIFERFYTTMRRSPDAKRGIGLGLAICDAIVRAHGGEISASNRPEGGASFTFTLPMREDAARE